MEISNPTTPIELLSIAEGDFPIKNLAQIVQSQLELTLREIQNKKNQVVQRNEQLDRFIAMLEQWEKDNT